MTKAHWQNGQMTTTKEKKVWFQSANAQVIGLASVGPPTYRNEDEMNLRNKPH